MTRQPRTSERLADLEALYREYHAFVWRTLYHLGLRDEAVNDTTQEVFLVVHRRLSSFDGRTAIKNWLYGIARRVAADHRKKHERRRARLHLVSSPDDQASDPSPLHRVSAAEQVQQLLDLLDDDKREVFVLAEVEGMTAPEIAQATGINLNTIYSRLRAARQCFHREARRQRAQRDRRRA